MFVREHGNVSHYSKVVERQRPVGLELRKSHAASLHLVQDLGRDVHLVGRPNGEGRMLVRKSQEPFLLSGP